MMPFEHIFVINRDSRTDRLRDITAEAQRNGFEFERFPAIEGGVAGCRNSHIQVCRIAKERGYKSYLALEDDAAFIESFNSESDRLYPKVPQWDMLLLGAEHQAIFTRQDEGIVRCHHSYKTHAMAVNSNFYDTFIQTLTDNTIETDVALARIHKLYHVYAFYPNLVNQRNGFSDLAGMYVDYTNDY
jgi:GR25 family glycosyltransferase involved in LPS biosynthesis